MEEHIRDLIQERPADCPLVRVGRYSIITGLASYDFSRKTIVATINPHSYVVAERDMLFRRALCNADRLAPDGVGIVYAVRLLEGRRIERISGMELFMDALMQASRGKRRLFFLGGEQRSLDGIKSRLTNEYPELEAGYFSPPFRKTFSREENESMIEAVNAFRPDFLFVGMSAPKQEKWVEKNKDRLNARVIMSIGAEFDYYAKTVSRPGSAIRQMGFQWLFRFLMEPGRLWRRTFISMPKYVFKMISLGVRKIGTRVGIKGTDN